MKGPNAVADVTPLGGRQMSWRGCRAFSLGFNNPSRCRSAPYADPRVGVLFKAIGYGLLAMSYFRNRVAFTP